jgi:hypothetical protein
LLSAGLETKIADAMRQHGWLFFVMPPNYGSRATRVILKRGPEIIKDFMSGANKGLFLCRSSPLRIMSEASNPHTTGGCAPFSLLSPPTRGSPSNPHFIIRTRLFLVPFGNILETSGKNIPA